MLEDPEQAWTVWLTIALILFGIEVALLGGGGGILFALAVMAAAGMTAALLGFSLTTQIVIAITIGLLSLPFMVWIFRRKGRGGGPPGAEDSALRKTTFQAYYDPRGNLRVLAHGDHLMAIPASDVQTAIEDGAAVQIVRMEGTRAIVRPVNQAVGEPVADADTQRN